MKGGETNMPNNQTENEAVYLKGLEFGLRYRGLTVEELAQQTGLSVRTIKNYVECKTEPKLRNAVKIAKILHCEYGLLF